MNCLKKTYSILISLILFVFLLIPTKIFANYTSLALNPAQGTIYGDETWIIVSVDSGAQEFIGLDVDLSFTGPVEYLGATGVERCSNFVVTPGIGSLNIECISLSHPPGQTYIGNVAVLKFKGTGTGTSTFTFTRTDPANIGQVAEATYSVTTALGGKTGSLPDAGLFDNTLFLIILGAFVLFFGISYSKIVDKYHLLTGTMSKKMDESKVQKRRGRVEKDF